MNKKIAITIIKQLGGYNRLRAFINAKDFLDLGNGLQFSFKGSRLFNQVSIRLNPMDTYDVTFYKFGNAPGFNLVRDKTFYDVYCDQLISLFEEITGLYLSM